MFRRACLIGILAMLPACQSLDSLLKLKPDLPRVAASAAVGVDGASSPAAVATPAISISATATPAGDATTRPTPVPAGPTPTPTPFLDFVALPQATATASPTPTPRPTATPTPSQPETCTRTRQVISVGGPQHGRFNGAILPREWASVYANEDEVLMGIDHVYQTDWACFQAFYPDATAVYKKLRGRS
jgi:hypothetical protein